VNAIVQGSLSAIAKQQNKSLAETFMQADVIVIVDTSGSMAIRDSRGGKSRYDVACEELAKLQSNMPGKVALISFSERSVFCPSGVPDFMAGTTNLAGALKFTKIADVPGMRFFVISDGQPDSETDALTVARTYTNRIDTIFVGPEDDYSSQEFLRRLAKASGGQSVTCDRVKELASSVQTLLLKG
jgi:Mg-chelatase subunit ChlD